MTTSIYTVYDKIAMRCGPIFHAVNDDDAIRGYKKRYRDQEDRADYKLLKLGVFDHMKGTCECVDVPEEISINWPTRNEPKED